MEPRSIAASAGEFEHLCVQILTKLGYQNDTEFANWRNPDQADFVGIAPNSSTRVIVECKLTISRQTRPVVINQGIAQLLRKRETLPEAQLLLIISSPLPNVYFNIAAKAGVDEVWDLPLLLLRAAEAGLYEKLAEFLREIGVGDLGTLGDAPILPLPERTDTLQPDKQGEALWKELHAIQSGRDGAIAFEKACEKALKHLFGDQFGAWHSQSQSEEGFHRRDFLVRLRPRHDFWISLAHDFRSRYIIFEFKNYSNPISQAEIYSTEKYLFTTALRSVAIVIARSGADSGASRAASGALREAGKLILILSLDDVCEMLHASDRGEEPEILLYQRLDQLLTTMLR
jgi:hypothetical protein